MFSECLSLEEINFFGFESFNIINMKRLFFRCTALKRINFINFDTSKVKTLSEVFRECISLEEIYLNNFNTKKVDDMSGKEYKYLEFQYTKCGKYEFYVRRMPLIKKYKSK